MKSDKNLNILAGKWISLCMVVSWLVVGCDRPPDKTKTADVIIYGGTSAAISAAIQVTRMGKTVLIVCPDKHLGGLTSSGLGFTDTGDKSVIGGMAREFTNVSIPITRNQKRGNGKGRKTMEM